MTAPDSYSKAIAEDTRSKSMFLAALGIVFGDIGTSPLYALKTVFEQAGGAPSYTTALGLVSLIIWALIIVVSVKYITFVMRADNDGEGGVLALLSLLRSHKHNRPAILALGLFGAALIYGDGAITPAISVLSAMEGLEIAAPHIAPFILPLSVVVLVLLFTLQSQGTSRIGWLFGPVMLLWFGSLGLLGLWGIVQHPSVLLALFPGYGLHFLLTHGSTAFVVLGGVFLAVTGAEALYADMGHIGAASIRKAWYRLVLPALVLNYMGQTGLYMSGGTIEGNVFFRLCPPPLVIPLVLLSVAATVIASQAMITGAFSITRQAIQLGWCPRLKITQTSSEGYGQIYIGSVNWLLMILTVGLALMFKGSDKLASAYGIAVSLTMIITTILLFVATREIWQWKLSSSLAIAGVFLCIDMVFVASNMTKIHEGGWVPLVIAAAIYCIQYAWRRGTVALAKAMHSMTIPIDEFIDRLNASGAPRVPGTAVFLSKATEQTPPLIMWHVSHSRALHKYVVALSVVVSQTPWVSPNKRLTVEYLAPNFWRVIGHYGFMEKPDIPVLLHQARQLQPDLNLDDVVYYVGRETIKPRLKGKGLPLWQERLFALMRRNSAQVHDYLNLPSGAVVEIGRRVEI